jgi:hypothetical protein
MTTKQNGTVAVGAVLAQLVQQYPVLVPIGDNERYDLVIEKDGEFKRVQCKVGRYKNGTIRFNAASTNLVKGKWVRNNYKGQVEYFGVYCPTLKKVYLVPIQDVVVNNEASLRVDALARNRTKGILWAAGYEI